MKYSPILCTQNPNKIEPKPLLLQAIENTIAEQRQNKEDNAATHNNQHTVLCIIVVTVIAVNYVLYPLINAII